MPDDLPFGKVHGIKCEPYLEWLRGRTCVVHSCKTPGEAMHIKPKKWGDVANAVPCCHAHHIGGAHTQGHKTFQKEHDIDLTLQAAYYWYCFCTDGGHK